MRIRIRNLLGIILATAILAAGAHTQAGFPEPPGTVVDHSPAASGLYIGSPSLAVLPNGDYLASHDLFGPKSAEHQKPVTVLFRSSDQGQTWTQVSKVQGAFWSSLFVHRGAAYLMGVAKGHGPIVIRRSADGGITWSEPVDSAHGLIADGQYHTAPVPVIEHKGRLWRAFEDATGGTAWGLRYKAGMLSAPVDADLLNATNWTLSNFLPSDKAWLKNGFGGWLEGNAVRTPEGRMIDILRVDTPGLPETAAIVEVSDDGKTATFNVERDFIPFPGGAKKFTIRYDPKSSLYWAIAGPVAEVSDKTARPGSVRNTLSLISSADLRSWKINSVLLKHPDAVKHGFQYVDWQFDGEDIIAICRTAFDDAQGGAHSYHDANYLTFHRIKDFRTMKVTDSK